jgi:hypothetical protein
MVASFRKFSFFLCFIFSFNSFLPLRAQVDSLPENHHHSAANISDSVANRTMHYKPQFVTNLSHKINETSALLIINGQLWTLNDSGNQPEIYCIDSTNGSVLRTVVIMNAVNTDWESMAQDDFNVYIGDFGNNAGNRKDLRILKIAKAELLNPVIDSVRAGYIYFKYPDQIDFTHASNRNNFDCEAFFCHNDSLHLFSKNWSDLHTKHYVLPVDTGNYIARLTERFKVDGLITDASINTKGNIVLLGYKNIKGRRYTCFAWLLKGFVGSEFLAGEKRRLELGSALRMGQTEGIVLNDDDTGWLSSERILAGWLLRPAKLFRFDFRKYF